MGRLLVSPGCAVALGAFAPAHRRFHHGARLPVSDHHGHPRLDVGQVCAAGTGLMALPLSALRQSVGAARLEKTHSPVGPARAEPMTILASEPLHVAQIGFFLDPQGRAPAQLLEAWATLVDVAEAAARPGTRVSVVPAGSS